MKIPFYLVTGFLGSGKTTLIKNILEDFCTDYKIGIIQNEFAESNIDSKELKHTGKSFEILEINKGSVFCVCLLSDFIQSLRAFILEVKPDIIILEASGLSDPIAIGELMQSPELHPLTYLKYIWCIVDAGNFSKMQNFMQRTVHQIRVADTVIVNKTDIAPDAFPQISSKVKALNPYAKIADAQFCKVELAGDLAMETLQPPVGLRTNLPKEKNPGRPSVQTEILKTNKIYDRSLMLEFIKKLLPRCMRIKGFINLGAGKALGVQASFEHLKISEVENYFSPTELIFIGTGFEQGEINRTFKNYEL